MMVFRSSEDLPESDDAHFFKMRQPGKAYISRVFPYNRPNSSDIGQDARIIRQVFDCKEVNVVDNNDSIESDDRTMSIGKRTQVKIVIAKQRGHYKELLIQKINSQNDRVLSNVLTLHDEQVKEFIDLLNTIDALNPSDNLPERVDCTSFQTIMNDNEALHMVYGQKPETFRNLIESDVNGEDVIAIQGRKEAVKHFEEMLADSSLAERDWQQFFEENSWILGAGLGVPLFTSWNSEKLETVVQGSSFAGVGKRVDALYTTSGIIKSFVFAEIKKPNTPLLDSRTYRPGCWSPSAELSGGIAQVHATIQEAEDNISNHLLKQETDDGYEIPNSEVYLFHPRAYLIIGDTGEFVDPNTGGKNKNKIRSFELFRSSIITPEIITYDELLAKVQWLVNVENNYKSQKLNDEGQS